MLVELLCHLNQIEDRIREELVADLEIACRQLSESFPAAPAILPEPEPTVAGREPTRPGPPRSHADRREHAAVKLRAHRHFSTRALSHRQTERRMETTSRQVPRFWGEMPAPRHQRKRW